MFSTQPCDGVDDDGGVAVVKACGGKGSTEIESEILTGIGVAPRHHQVGPNSSAAVTSSSFC